MENITELYQYFLKEQKHSCIIKRYLKDELIFNEGDTLKYVCIIKKGKVLVFKNTKHWDERILFILDEMSILNEEIIYSSTSKASTCARAYTDTEIIKIPKNIVLQKMKTDSFIMEFLFRSTSMKLTRTYRQLKNSGTNVTIEKKIASKLWKLCQDYGITTEKGIIVDLNLSSIIIAKMIGAKRETVSRSINSLKKEGVVLVESNKITVIDIVKLKNKCD